MRALKWIARIFAGAVLLLVAAILVITLLVDPNRFKGRIEAAVREATGQPFQLRGDLDIAWYPWLAVRAGPAQLGEGPPILQWQAARVGAKLIPLLRGQLIISRVRLEGLQVRLVRDVQGRGNWEKLLSREAGGGSRQLHIEGVEIRDGAVDYLNERDGSRLRISRWQLDMDEWRSGEPFALETGFNLADAQVQSSLDVRATEPLNAQGTLSLKAPSLRKLFADLALNVPRPRDANVLGAFTLSSQWHLQGSAITVKPIQMKLDQTSFTGEVERPTGADAAWRFALRGDRIDLGRYTDVEDDDSEPFELPVAALKALRVRGVLWFDEARLAQAQMKDVRLRIELEDGRVQTP